MKKTFLYILAKIDQFLAQNCFFKISFFFGQLSIPYFFKIKYCGIAIFNQNWRFFYFFCLILSSFLNERSLPENGFLHQCFKIYIFVKNYFEDSIGFIMYIYKGKSKQILLDHSIVVYIFRIIIKIALFLYKTLCGHL